MIAIFPQKIEVFYTSVERFPANLLKNIDYCFFLLSKICLVTFWPNFESYLSF